MYRLTPNDAVDRYSCACTRVEALHALLAYAHGDRVDITATYRWFLALKSACARPSLDDKADFDKDSDPSLCEGACSVSGGLNELYLKADYDFTTLHGRPANDPKEVWEGVWPDAAAYLKRFELFDLEKVQVNLTSIRDGLMAKIKAGDFEPTLEDVIVRCNRAIDHISEFGDEAHAGLLKMCARDVLAIWKDILHIGRGAAPPEPNDDNMASVAGLLETLRQLLQWCQSSPAAENDHAAPWGNDVVSLSQYMATLQQKHRVYLLVTLDDTQPHMTPHGQNAWHLSGPQNMVIGDERIRICAVSFAPPEYSEIADADGGQRRRLEIQMATCHREWWRLARIAGGHLMQQQSNWLQFEPHEAFVVWMFNQCRADMGRDPDGNFLSPVLPCAVAALGQLEGGTSITTSPHIEEATAVGSDAEEAGDAAFIKPTDESKIAKSADQDDKEEIFKTMPPSAKNAYFGFQWALTKKSVSNLTDRAAYDLLSEDGIPDDLGADYRLPGFSTWSRHLRTARHLLNEQKNSRRAGRQAGKSIVGEHCI